MQRDKQARQSPPTRQELQTKTANLIVWPECRDRRRLRRAALCVAALTLMGSATVGGEVFSRTKDHLRQVIRTSGNNAE